MTMALRMILVPAPAPSGKGARCSFRGSGGRGLVQVKGEARGGDAPGRTWSLRLAPSRGSGGARAWRPQPWVQHDFARSALCALQEEGEPWDFAQMVDPASQTFVVRLEAL